MIEKLKAENIRHEADLDILREELREKMRDAIRRAQRQCDPDLVDAIVAQPLLDAVDAAPHRNAFDDRAGKRVRLVEASDDAHAELRRPCKAARDPPSEAPGAGNRDPSRHETAAIQRAQRED